MKVKITKIKKVEEQASTQDELEQAFSGYTELNRLSKGLIEESDELEFVISKKIETIQKLNDEIDALELKIEKMKTQIAQGQPKTKPPTTDQLLRWCSYVSDATKGKLTPDKKVK